MAKSTRFFGRNVRTVETADFGATVSTLETGERVGTADSAATVSTLETGVGGATVWDVGTADSAATVSTLETGVGGATVWDVGTVVRITKAALGVKREKSSVKRDASNGAGAKTLL